VSERICVIPGAFDPVTVGHLDIIERAAEIFDKIYVTAFDNTVKKYMFSAEERREMLRLACLDLDKVTADSAGGLLLSDYAKSKGADFLVKGARGAVDYEYEYQLFLINKEIGGIETVFFPAKREYIYISSTFVREMIKYKRDISTFVPRRVADFIKNIVK
jgi:pantetheine-phosphate adenylyltransferase